MKVSILIPCYNEELTIAACVESCLAQTLPPHEIIVVNDGSTDRTRDILRAYERHVRVIDVLHNTGAKGKAQEYGLQFVEGDVLVMTDADTLLDRDFLLRIVPHFVEESVHAVAGHIRALAHNWLTACRELEYIVAQDIHKRAQAHLRSVIVIPGCAAAWRTESFRRYVTFSHDTLTEDMDFTFQFYRNGLTVEYDERAIVYTQDPDTLSSYIKQIRRWIGGGWQNMRKHWRLMLTRRGHAFELSLIYCEGLASCFLVLCLPLINVVYLWYLFLGYLLSSCLVGIYACLRTRKLRLLRYVPLFALVLLINSYVFFEQFVITMLIGRRSLVWFRPERRLQPVLP